MDEKRTILLTGGGTAGHVTPNLALLDRLEADGYTIHYAGTADGIERELIAERGGVAYHTISSGKLRRYFSLKTLAVPFKLIKGVAQSRRIIREVDPDVVFSKGGFVSVPVVVASRGRVPVVTHESDYTPGLANRINARFADAVCVTFEDTLGFVGEKGVHTGTPIRPELYRGEGEKAMRLLGFDGGKPVLLVMGGSLGAARVNEAVRAALDELLPQFDIVHLCGKGKLDGSIDRPGYVQYEYLSAALPHVLKAADIVVSRAGANAVFELLALAKPMLLIPLPIDYTRGDQEQNAEYFCKKGYAMVLEQKDLTTATLVNSIRALYERRLTFATRMSSEALADGTDEVLSVIEKYAEVGRGLRQRRNKGSKG